MPHKTPHSVCEREVAIIDYCGPPRVGLPLRAAKGQGGVKALRALKEGIDPRLTGRYPTGDGFYPSEIACGL